MGGKHETTGSPRQCRSDSQGDLEAELEGAVARRELVILYQPIVDLSTLRVTAVEALLRWRHPERGLLPPDAFIPAAEKSGLIVPIGAWALQEACRGGRAWQERRPTGSPLLIAVNVAALQLHHPTFIADLRGALETSGLHPEWLLLELTETMLLERDVVGPTLDQVKRLGVGLAVDDFGAGYSSLRYLARFPFDALKIDKSYVDLLTVEHPRAFPLVRGIVLLARSLSLRTIAEGVESAEQRALLRAAGCQLGQGSLFDAPLDATALEALLQRAEHRR